MTIRMCEQSWGSPSRLHEPCQSPLLTSGLVQVWDRPPPALLTLSRVRSRSRGKSVIAGRLFLATLGTQPYPQRCCLLVPSGLVSTQAIAPILITLPDRAVWVFFFPFNFPWF